MITVSSGGDIQVTLEAAGDGGSTGRQTGVFGTIPAEFTGYIDAILINADPKRDVSLNVYTRSAEDLGGGNFQPRLQPLKIFLAQELGQIILPNPIVMPSKHDVWMTAKNIGAPGSIEININTVVRLLKNA